MPILGIFASSISGSKAINNSYESIQSVSVGSGGTASITFSSIPSTYTHLQVRGILQSARPTFSRDEYKIRINSDTGNNYAWHNIYGITFTATNGNWNQYSQLALYGIKG